jgi:formamidopyrimidine-DNA glycosylase
MPELPEVETVRRTLAASVEGRVIMGVEILSAHCADHRPEELRGALEGRRILALARHGKHLLFRLDRGVIDVHLRMTGKLLAGGAPSPYTRAVLALNRGAVLFEDVRQFGRLRYLEDESELRLGPDALEIPLEALAAILRESRARIKPLLLDQQAIAGIGNIYADEALHAARIHPRAIASRLAAARAARLHQAVQSILAAAIDAGGSSISDYVDAGGNRGGYQAQHRVYGRAGQPCPACGTSIRRIVLNQRATHFCPRCQPR